MKKLLSFKVFGLSHLALISITLLSALSFFSLSVIEWRSADTSRVKLEEYTKSYLNYNELSPELVQKELQGSIGHMAWKESLKIENTFFQKAKNLNNGQNSSWKNFENVHLRFNSLLNKLKKTKVENTKKSFDKKIERLSAFVNKNNWKRLSRIAKRLEVMTKEQQLTSKTIAQVDRNLNKMKTVTESSLLSNYEKSIILAKITRINEIQKITDAITSKKEVFIVMNVYVDQLAKWHGEVGNNFLKMRNGFSNHDFYTNFFLMAGAIFLSLAIIFGLFFRNIIQHKQDFIEEEFERILDGVLFGKDDISANRYQENFHRLLERTKEHLFRRMNFGRVAEEGIPFPSFLVDQNLKVVWMNKMAQERLGVNFSLTDSDYLNWDHLKQLTSFNDFDPIVDAINFQNGGVFDTSLNLTDGSSDRAEFFVSPVEMEDQKYVFVSLQLQSYYQEAIEDNKNSIVSPLSDTLNYLLTERFETTDIERKKVSFDSIDTRDIYPLIEKVVNRYIEAIVSLKEALDIACEDNKSKEGEVHALLNSKEVNVKVMNAQTQNFKVLRSNITELDKVVLDSFVKLGKLQSTLSEHLTKISTQQDHFARVRTDVDKIKNDVTLFKKLLRDKKVDTTDIRGQKIEVSHLMNQASNNGSDSALASKLDQLLGNLEGMDLFYRELDVHLGKLEYYFDEITVSDESTNYDLGEFKTKLEKDFYALDQMENNFELILDGFANNLENQYRVLKGNSVIRNQIDGNRSSSLESSPEIS